MANEYTDVTPQRAATALYPHQVPLVVTASYAQTASQATLAAGMVYMSSIGTYFSRSSSGVPGQFFVSESKLWICTGSNGWVTASLGAAAL